MKLLLILMLSFSSIGLAAETVSPYSGQEKRTIKALSDSDIEGYLSGGGMGLAKAAELNKYPGPKHVLEISDEIGLTEDQEEKTKLLFESMNLKAKELGAQLVEKERALDTAFAQNSITPDLLKGFTKEIAILHGKIRFVHLEAHLAQTEILSKRQIHKYGELRGYGQAHTGHH